ncbi:MAG: LamG domain-containing protein [Victivallaceae bacterium]|nr:LamG domain-containing protein [Victivallaceae bacterium]
MKKISILLVILFGLFNSLFAAIQTVPTFESIGIYWPQNNSGQCRVYFRENSKVAWQQGLNLVYDSNDGEYRGSIVGLVSGKNYQVKLIAGTVTETTSVTTWAENFTVGSTTYLPTTSNSRLTISTSGSAGNYRLYTPASGNTAEINVAKQDDYCIYIDASYVIIRGLTLKAAAKHAIFIASDNLHDIIIEGCDISDWGSLDTVSGFARNYDSAVYSHKKISRVIIQNNKIHHPTYDANNWKEFNATANSYHPGGAQAVSFFNSTGNHVIRYNEIYSDFKHYFNDGLGGGDNFSNEGFPHQDSDIYGNIISHCWDDGIESEGGNINNRIWNNYFKYCYVQVAVATTSKGPIYVWNNVSSVSLIGNASDPDGGPGYGSESGSFLKNKLLGGKIYVFQNTTLQPTVAGLTYPVGITMGLGHGSVLLNGTSRNNILSSLKPWRTIMNIDSSDLLGNYDYDLLYGNTSNIGGFESNGILATLPIFNSNYNSATVDLASGNKGNFYLDQSSPGYQAGQWVSNFNTSITTIAPDMGAGQYASPALWFGNNAMTQCSVAAYYFNGSFTDITDFTNDGIAYGTTLNTDSEKSYLALDGNSYLACGSNLALTTSNFTIAFWAKRTDVSVDNNVFGKYQSYGNQIMANLTYNNKLDFQVRKNNLIIIQLKTTELPGIADSNWHHYAIVIDKDNFTTNSAIYVDGVKLNSYQNFSWNGDTGTIANSGELCLGTINTSSTNKFNGGIDDFVVFNYAMRDEHIQTLYNPLLMLHLPFIADSSIVSDNSKNGLDGVVNGTVTFPAGKLDDAIKFGSNGYLSIGSAPELNFNQNNFSLGFWCKRNDKDVTANIMGRYYNSSNYWRATISYHDKLEFIAMVGGVTQAQIKTGELPSLIDDNNWHYYTLSVDRTNANNCSWYVDGQSISSYQNRIAISGNVIDNSGDLFIGKIYANSSNMLDDAMDELKFFRRDLNASEILNLYKSY